MVDARRALGVVALAGVLAVTGCTADKPAEPAPSPTPAAQTPSETAQERQERLDYAAAEKSYRTFRAEYNRVLRAGGAKEPTKLMTATAGGKYLTDTMQVVRAFKGLNYRTAGPEKIDYVHEQGHSPTEVNLEVCEDGTKIVQIDADGKRTPVGELRTLQLQVRRTPSGWKVWSGTGKKVTTCD